MLTKMKLELYQIDAFTDKFFGGNPACVVPLPHWISDDILFKITKENAVAETAFFVKKEDEIQLRWFTPEIEMDLCGHATLAAAHCLKTILNFSKETIVFQTKSGEITVTCNNEIYHLNFPSRMPIVSELPDEIKNALSITPKKIYKSRDYVLIYDSETDIRNLKIDRQILDQINLGTGGVVATAKGNDYDFVSRYFTPQASILEDPVTGSAHCSLIPYWAKELKKEKLNAIQLSERIGYLNCEFKKDRVQISGKARTYLIGNIWTS